MSDQPQTIPTLRAQAPQYTIAGGLLSVAMAYLLAPAVRSDSHGAVLHNGVTGEALVRSVDELKGAITTLTTTTTTGFQNMTREIQDGQRRDDKHDFEIASLKATRDAQARQLRDIENTLRTKGITLPTVPNRTEP